MNLCDTLDEGGGSSYFCRSTAVFDSWCLEE